MYTRVSTPPTSTSTTPTATLYRHHFHALRHPYTKEITMRIDPSDIHFLILAALLLLLSAFTLGGLAAHPFAG